MATVGAAVALEDSSISRASIRAPFARKALGDCRTGRPFQAIDRRGCQRRAGGHSLDPGRWGCVRHPGSGVAWGGECAPGAAEGFGPVAAAAGCRCGLDPVTAWPDSDGAGIDARALGEQAKKSPAWAGDNSVRSLQIRQPGGDECGALRRIDRPDLAGFKRSLGLAGRFYPQFTFRGSSRESAWAQGGLR